tara:strand:- start:2027 stop:3043 length:1017 start_codon:yes stop_codon:yes gene_type:complete
MKPKFIMSAGTGWSATTPLWYTLQLDNKYLHTGYRKEGSYLKELSMSPQERLRSNLQARRNQGISALQKTREMAKKVLKERDEYQTKNIKEIGSLVPSWEYQGSLAAVREDLYLTQEDIDEFISLPQSLDKYIAYYKKVWETLQEHNCPHHAVADFSNSNASLSRSFVESIIPKLQEHFDVKVLMIVRDPIRRLWSESGAFLKGTQEDHERTFLERVASGRCWDYMEIIESYEGLVPIHIVIMEQLWEGYGQDEEKYKLSKFLNYDIDEVHINVYSPDHGPNAPQYPGLPDQWHSDKYYLREEFYNQVRPLFKVYEQWVDKYGSLPLYWGQPYNYAKT